MKKLLVVVVTTTLMTAAGCGGDDGDGGNLQAYCRLSAGADDNTAFPSDEELEEFRDAAPAEIRDDIDTVIDALQSIEDPEDDREALEELLGDEDVVDATERVEAFEAENCDEAGSDSSGSGSSVSEEDAGDPEETTSTTEAEVDTDTADSGGRTGTFCDELSDERASELTGFELSSAETFNIATECTYESDDHVVRLVIAAIPSQPQPVDIFLQAAEQNVDEFEQLDGIAQAAYFAINEPNDAFGNALGDDFVGRVGLSLPDGEEPAQYREVIVQLLELVVSTQ